MIVIFEDGNVDTCKVRPKAEFMEVWPLEENDIIVDDFKIACTSKADLLDEIRELYSHIDYIAIKNWKTHEKGD